MTEPENPTLTPEQMRAETSDIEEMQAHYAAAIHANAKLRDTLEAIHALSNCPPEIEQMCLEALSEDSPEEEEA